MTITIKPQDTSETFERVISKPSPLPVEVQWGGLTLSSLSHSAQKFIDVFEYEGELNALRLARLFNDRVEDSHSWLWNDGNVPILDLFNLVNISDYLKNYMNTGDPEYLDEARALISG